MIRDEILAIKIIERALSDVKEKLEPLTYAVNILTPKAVGEEIHCVATDGNYLFFNAFQTIQYYERGEVSTIEYQIIHILLHGILGHFEDTAYVRKKLAWRVMDLSVEQIKLGFTTNTLNVQKESIVPLVWDCIFRHRQTNGWLRRYCGREDGKRLMIIDIGGESQRKVGGNPMEVEREASYPIQMMM